MVLYGEDAYVDELLGHRFHALSHRILYQVNSIQTESCIKLLLTMRI